MITKNNLILSFLLLLLTPTNYAELINITSDSDFETKVNKSDKKVVIKFGADWCGACKQVKKPFNELAQEKEFGHILFAAVDSDLAKKTCDHHKVVGVPTFVYMDRGVTKGRDVGVKDKATFKDDMRTKIRSTFKIAKQEIEADSDIISHDNTKQNSIGLLDTIATFFVTLRTTFFSLIERTLWLKSFMF